MRQAMEIEEWCVLGSFYSQTDPAQQFQLNLGKVLELEPGKSGCEITCPRGVWNMVLEVQKASGQKQSVLVENTLPTLYQDSMQREAP